MEENLLHQKLGKYEIQSEIGRGGMGMVYKGYDDLLDRHVAIKVLAPHLVWQEEFVERFLREARSAARLKHANIVTIYDVGQEGNWYYFVMEYLEGRSLTDLIEQRGAFPNQAVINILEPLGDALDYAHKTGLVHRDIKPSNIVVSTKGHVTLTDFGIARAAQEARLTSTGAVVGTPEYMSPEQAQGLDVDARSDQYSLAVMTYKMLSGRVPFAADSTLALMFKVVHEPPPPLADIRPDLSNSVHAVLKHAMAKEPNDRYPTVTDFVSTLTRALQGEHLSEAALTPVPVPVPAGQAAPAPSSTTVMGAQGGAPAPTPAPQAQQRPATHPSGVAQQQPVTHPPAAQPTYPGTPAPQQGQRPITHHPPAGAQATYPGAMAVAAAPGAEAQSPGTNPPTAPPTYPGATPYTPQPQPQEKSRRSPWMWVAIASIVLILALVGGGLWGLSQGRGAANAPTATLGQPTTDPTATQEQATATIAPTSTSANPDAAADTEDEATDTPEPTDTPEEEPTATPEDDDEATPTPEEEEEATPTPEPTATATAQPTPTEAPTASGPTRTPGPTATPELAGAAAPQLLGPPGGGQYKNPIAFKWSGAIGGTQSYQVTTYHVETNYVMQSPLLTTESWTVDVPADKFGEWRWYVTVSEAGQNVAKSEEWMYWFNPGFGGDSGGGGGGTGGTEEPVEPTRGP